MRKPQTLTLTLIGICVISCQQPKNINQFERLQHTTREFHKIESADIVFYLQTHQNNLAIVESETRRALSKSCSIVGINSYDKKLHHFVFNSPEDIERTIGVRTNGCAYTSINCILSVYSVDLNTVTSSHEFTHVLSHNEWGQPKNAWLDEGLAVYSDNRWWGFPLHPLARKLKENGKLKPLSAISKYTIFGTSDSIYAYPQSGSFVKYLYEKYGLEFIKQLWKHGTTNPSGHPSITSLEREWLGFLETIQPLDAEYP